MAEDVAGCADLRGDPHRHRRLRDGDRPRRIRPADRRRCHPGRAARHRAGRRHHRGPQDRRLRPGPHLPSPGRTTARRSSSPPACSCSTRWPTASTSSATRTPRPGATAPDGPSHRLEDGMAEPADAPGLGIEIDEAKLTPWLVSPLEDALKLLLPPRFEAGEGDPSRSDGG